MDDGAWWRGAGWLGCVGQSEMLSPGLGRDQMSGRGGGGGGRSWESAGFCWSYSGHGCGRGEAKAGGCCKICWQRAVVLPIYLGEGRLPRRGLAAPRTDKKKFSLCDQHVQMRARCRGPAVCWNGLSPTEWGGWPRYREYVNTWIQNKINKDRPGCDALNKNKKWQMIGSLELYFFTVHEKPFCTSFTKKLIMQSDIAMPLAISHCGPLADCITVSSIVWSFPVNQWDDGNKPHWQLATVCILIACPRVIGHFLVIGAPGLYHSRPFSCQELKLCSVLWEFMYFYLDFLFSSVSHFRFPNVCPLHRLSIMFSVLKPCPSLVKLPDCSSLLPGQYCRYLSVYHCLLRSRLSFAFGYWNVFFLFWSPCLSLDLCVFCHTARVSVWVIACTWHLSAFRCRVFHVSLCLCVSLWQTYQHLFLSLVRSYSSLVFVYLL